MAIRGRKPRPSRRGKARAGTPIPPDALPRCPAHLSAVARKEWRRLAKPLFEAGILTTFDRGAFAAYCQAYSRWVEAEEQLKKTPLLLKTPSGYVQQSPWLSVSNKQLELMGRFMAELGITPAARTRLASTLPDRTNEPLEIRIVSFCPDGTLRDEDGNAVEKDEPGVITIDGRL